MLMPMKYKSALSPPLSVQLTITFTAPLVTSSERLAQEGVEKEGGPEEINVDCCYKIELKQLRYACCIFCRFRAIYYRRRLCVENIFE